MHTSYLARTQKIEEIVTLNTLMKPYSAEAGWLVKSSWPLEDGVIVTWLPG